MIAFLSELSDMLLNEPFDTFTQQMVDKLIGALRGRGNSNATINRKMAALSKLQRKAFKMGDLHSLPAFKRQKEKAGRIRFLDRDEERRLFQPSMTVTPAMPIYASFQSIWVLA